MSKAVTVETIEPVAAAPAVPVAAAGVSLQRRLRRRLIPLLVPMIVPLLLLIGWDLSVRLTGTRLIPPPRDVAIMLYDFSFGGVYDDAFSKTIHIHFWKSIQRVYGGFFMAAAVGIPLGLLIGRVRFIRALIDPTLQLLRPVPVTAWLPLSMIFFGLGPRAAIFLVFLGAFFPILLNITFDCSVLPSLPKTFSLIGKQKDLFSCSVSNFKGNRMHFSCNSRYL